MDKINAIEIRFPQVQREILHAEAIAGQSSRLWFADRLVLLRRRARARSHLPEEHDNRLKADSGQGTHGSTESKFDTVFAPLVVTQLLLVY